MIYEKFDCFFKNLKHEINVNVGAKMKIAICLYRVSSFCFNKGGMCKILVTPFYIIYRIYSEFMVGMEFPVSVKAGEGLRIYHGNGLVVHPDTKLGKHCTLRQNVTIGNKISRDGMSSSSPVIGDDVEFGAGAVVIGSIEIGSGVTIGANTVVTKNIPAHSVVVGQSFRILEY